MLTCVRWYVAYPLSLRHLEEMMSEPSSVGRPFDGAPVGYQAAACAREGIRTAQAKGRSKLANGRDLQ